MHGIGHRFSFIVWAVVLSVGITPCLAQGPSLSGAWRQARVKWIKPPAELHLNERQGEASTLYFASDHRFMLLYASVIQSPRAETISHGDGQVVFLGTWQMDGGKLGAKFRLVSRTVSQEGEALPGPIQKETVRLSGAALMFRRKRFLRDTRLDNELSMILQGASARSVTGDNGQP
jgi:hypothetical protein